jgi:tetratricopeptide (TPR) repeat protein
MELLGEEHHATATILNNLASLVHDQGAYAEAHPLYERALEIRKTVLGEEHPDTANSLFVLALLLKDQGAYAEARSLLERALEITKQVFGEEHPYTKTVRTNLAYVERSETSGFFRGLLHRLLPRRSS